MHSTNPYAQGGWHNPQNPNSINLPSWSIPPLRQPSVVGALPVLGAVTPLEAGTLTFRLSPAYPDILNCFLYTPKGIPYVEVVTGTRAGGYAATTYFRKVDGTLLAFVDWGQQTTVNIPGIVKQKPVNEWLPFSADKQRRMMFVKDRPFTWVRQQNETKFKLFAVGSIFQEPVAKTSQSSNCVILELTSEAIQNCLLESAIVATALLYSGRV